MGKASLSIASDSSKKAFRRQILPLHQGCVNRIVKRSPVHTVQRGRSAEETSPRAQGWLYPRRPCAAKIWRTWQPPYPGCLPPTRPVLGRLGIEGGKVRWHCQPVWSDTYSTARALACDCSLQWRLLNFRSSGISLDRSNGLLSGRESHAGMG